MTSASAQSLRQHIPRLIFFFSLFMLGAVFGLFLGFQVTTVPAAFNTELNSIENCRSKLLQQRPNLIEQGSATLPHELRDYCYAEIQWQGDLNDYAIRKSFFLQQYRANSVLLWMVVLITFSGVILSGVQLAAAFKLASQSPRRELSDASEFIISRNQVTIKSSIVGLLILAISFGFFLVFVIYVYRMENPEPNAATRAQTPLLPAGGLGPPPAAVEQKPPAESGKNMTEPAKRAR